MTPSEVWLVEFDHTEELRIPLTKLNTKDLIIRCSVIITEAFDGPGAHISVGNGVSQAEYLFVTPSQVGQFETDEITQVLETENMILTLDLKGSTTGKGFLLYKVKRYGD
jgi:phosphoheptose isomerase